MNQHEISSIAAIDGRFLIKSLIDSGNMSSVYFAEDIHSGLEVAVKVFDSQHPDDLRRELFRRETNALNQLQHDHIVRFVKSGWSDDLGKFYLAMEFQPLNLQRFLKQRLQESKDISWCWPIVRDLCRALSHAHSNGIVHRDIKPSNILLGDHEPPHAYLSDFSTSKIKTELAVGMTLSQFWSPGYAAPEQREQGRADERSDIYSLGMVIYEILSGHPPQVDGPTSQELSAISPTHSVASILNRMTARDPALRYQSVLELIKDIESTSEIDSLPAYILVVTNLAMEGMREVGLINSIDRDAAYEKLLEELGGLEAGECYITNFARNSPDILIMGKTVSFRCSQDSHNPGQAGQALVVRSVRARYQPASVIDKRFAIPVRGFWQFSGSNFWQDFGNDELQESQDNISRVYDDLATMQLQSRTRIQRREKRAEVISTWDRTIRLQKSLLAKQSQTIQYEGLTIFGDRIEFQIGNQSIEELGWTENTQIAVRLTEEENKSVLIGSLVEINGNRITVARDSDSLWRDMDEDDLKRVPTGWLTQHLVEEHAILQRQESALMAFHAGQIVNPHLAQVLTEPPAARFSRILDIDHYFQPWLDDDKKNAVARAISAEDLFIIKGPPGTGKTSVIAEIVLQILRVDESARILLTSQSNVAVNNALSQIGELSGIINPRILRLGRQSNIGQGAEEWMLSARVDEWREQIISRTNVSKDSLSERIAQLRRDRRIDRGQDSIDPTGELENIRQWLSEASVALEEAESLESDMLTKATSNIGVGETASTEDSNLRSEVEARREWVRDQLVAIRSLWPLPLEGDPQPDSRAEISRLEVLATPRDDKSDELSRLDSIRTLMNDWQQIAGNGRDFQQYISKRSNVLGITCVYAGRKSQRDHEFDWVIVDESGRATPPEILIPMVKGKRVILVGDDRQLPPFIDANLTPENLRRAGMSDISREDLETSLFQNLLENAELENPALVCTLKTQYRMHPCISRLVSDVFYSGELRDGVTSADRQHNIDWIPRPLMWYSTSGLPDRSEFSRNQSYVNPGEVRVIVAILERIEASLSSKGIKKTVGVLSGYSAHASELSHMIQIGDRERWAAMDIELSTVDAIQGRDRDIIIYSTVNPINDGTLDF